MPGTQQALDEGVESLPTACPEAVVNSSGGVLGLSCLLCETRVTAPASWESCEAEGRTCGGFTRCPAHGHVVTLHRGTCEQRAQEARREVQGDTVQIEGLGVGGRHRRRGASRATLGFWPGRQDGSSFYLLSEAHSRAGLGSTATESEPCGVSGPACQRPGA